MRVTLPFDLHVLEDFGRRKSLFFNLYCDYLAVMHSNRCPLF